jgi:hypothetical protein
MARSTRGSWSAHCLALHSQHGRALAYGLHCEASSRNALALTSLRQLHACNSHTAATGPLPASYQVEGASTSRRPSVCS